VLASLSPRRQEILRGLGFEFEVARPSSEEEILDNPEETVRRNAVAKVESVAKVGDEAVYVGVDTVVYAGGRVLGKPRSEGEAVEMLRLLSGRWHSVYSGIYLLDASRWRGYFEAVKTDVLFDEIGEDEIRWYVSSGEPMDKAGAYGIQGLASLFIRAIRGCYYNVVGFPVNAFYRGLKALGYRPQDFIRLRRGST